MKKNKQTNWKKYGFEFLSIFIAVISAFALNNWNDNRKTHIAENKILLEIYNGLEKDLDDLKVNEVGHRQGNDAVIYFRDLLANKPVPKDAFLSHYLNLTRDFIAVQNISGYETLKSRGLEIVKNDSLRTDIIALYEYDYNILRKLEEEYDELQFQKNYFKDINRLISRNLAFNEDKELVGITTPLEISKEEEQLLLTYLWKIQANRNFILQLYTQVKNKIEKLRAEITEQIH